MVFFDPLTATLALAAASCCSVAVAAVVATLRRKET